MHPAIENLIDNQRQLDADGCEVGVSRQALDEAISITADLLVGLEEALHCLLMAYGEPGNFTLQHPRAAAAIRDARAMIVAARGP